MTPNELSYRDRIVKFNVKKLGWISSEKIYFHALENTKISQDFLQVPRVFFVTKLFQISPDFDSLVAHFSIWQHCC